MNDILLSKDVFFFEMLLRMNGNAFFAEWQSAFLINTKLADLIRMMKVAFVILNLMCNGSVS